MKLLVKSGLLLLLMLSSLSQVYAGDTGVDALRAALTKNMPQAAKAQIKTTPIKGLYEVMAGNQIMYMSEDARYIFDGDLYDMHAQKNMTEETRGGIRLGILNQLGEENMLVYMPEGKVKHTITVFTDIYCYYCRKLHKEIDEYMKNGVKVRYIFAPFKGQKSIDASISVWCAKDRTKALSQAKNDVAIEKKTCDNPISQHQALVSQLGIRGTPAIVLESGVMLGGYMPSDKVIAKLNAK